MESIYKVTSASVGKTNRGYKFFEIQLNSYMLATKLFPLRKYDLRNDKLYHLYEKNNGLDFLIGKYISLTISQSQYGHQFNYINSFDVFEDFKKEIDHSKGIAFSTRLPIYDFLKSINRHIEDDGSIKIKSEYGDMRAFKVDGVSICYQYDSGNEKLNINNISKIFKQFYEGVDLPVYALTADGQKSYYKISWKDVAIVRMDNHVKISYKMTTSGDYNKWVATKVLTIGDGLPDEYVDFLNEQS
ncbi:hypothetical protein [Aliidiomarina maris]|uniref:Uncharacterized protein n=1 Tax=Aliidiomarina maris TaxID=531312 RepID=A0A327WRQ7_9GAMM|nr:hypothetical protein [Aliidiomarina maris]RAJ93962.1 hypothetical protein B0I24_11565 [Aliidiomarina maris]RUO27533.1 hypothetical protein CWE07_02575 [Aliidiomarina maris]